MKPFDEFQAIFDNGCEELQESWDRLRQWGRTVKREGLRFGTQLGAVAGLLAAALLYTLFQPSLAAAQDRMDADYAVAHAAYVAEWGTRPVQAQIGDRGNLFGELGNAGREVSLTMPGESEPFRFVTMEAEPSRRATAEVWHSSVTDEYRVVGIDPDISELAPSEDTPGGSRFLLIIAMIALFICGCRVGAPYRATWWREETWRRKSRRPAYVR